MIDRQHAIDVEFADLRKSSDQHEAAPPRRRRFSAIVAALMGGVVGRVLLAFVAIYVGAALWFAAIDGFAALADATNQATLIGLALGLSGLFAYSD